MAKRVSALDATIRALGAEMDPWNDMDVAMAFPGDMHAEHNAIRETVGMWDTSALTKIYVRGPDALAAINYLVTRDIAKIYVGKSAYVPILQDNGHFCDDGFVFHLEEDVYLAVTSIGPSLEFLQGWAKGRNVSIELDENLHMITMQGPNSVALLDACTSMDMFGLRYCHQEQTALFGTDRIISRTGYSGERGYEIFVPGEDAVELWQQFMEHGKDYGHDADFVLRPGDGPYRKWADGLRRRGNGRKHAMGDRFRLGDFAQEGRLPRPRSALRSRR